MSEHARHAPSDARRWMKCPGAIQFTEDMPDRTSSYAAEGSVAHTIRALALQFEVSPHLWAGTVHEQDGYMIEVDATMGRFLEPGIDYLLDLGGQLFIENRVSIEAWTYPGEFGTLDAAVVLPDLIVIDDLKYGQGVTVSVENNPQLMLYALAFWWTTARHLTKARRVLLRIDQPRAGGVSEWETTVDELLIFGDAVRRAATYSELEGAPRIASKEACFWCDGKATCGEHAQYVIETIGFEVREPGNPGVPKLSVEERSHVLLHAEMVTKWLAALRASATSDAEVGRPTPGLKLVEGKAGDRIWRDPEAVEPMLVKALAQLAYEQELLSPTKAEKRLKTAQWEEVEPFVIRGPAGRPTLVPENDKRPAIASKLSKFVDHGDEDDNDPLS